MLRCFRPHRLVKKQHGATLITALMMLLVMTILAITAVKMSTLDLLIAGNDQQRMLLFQETETKLSELAITNKLDVTLGTDGFTGNITTEDYLFPINAVRPGISETITNMQEKYPCERMGEASSLGPNAPVCDLYDFKINAQKAVSSVRDVHHRGAGKMVPKVGSKADGTGGKVVMEDD